MNEEKELSNVKIKQKSKQEVRTLKEDTKKFHAQFRS